MRQPIPTVTFTASQMSAGLVQLSTFLLRARHAFLHTYHSPEHSDLDIFDQHQQLLIRCTLRVADADAAVPAPLASPAQGDLAGDLMSLLHDLVQTPSPAGRGQRNDQGKPA